MKMCQYKDDEDGCMFYFAYQYATASDKTVLYYQKTKSEFLRLCKLYTSYMYVIVY